MPIDADWANQAHTAVLLSFDPTWSWDDFEASTRAIFALMAEVDHPVDVITVNKTTSKPPDSQVFGHFQKFWVNRPPNMRRVLVVGANSFMVTMSDMFAKVFVGQRKVLYFLETMDDALALIEQPDVKESDS